jgi:uncharacterized protein (DUF4213/DUF364 family)
LAGWELYDALIDGISPDATADFIACGSTHAIAQSAGAAGISGMLDETWRPALIPNKKPGSPLRDIAMCARSWNFTEASLGLAAINAWYNDADRMNALGLNISDRAFVEDRMSDPFIARQNDVKGKKVTVIGHFPYVDRLFAPICDLSVIEKFYTKEGDYPEQAAEYLLPESDFVFISSYTFAEKTLPRYLELSAGARVTLVGPSTPVAAILHDFGVSDIAGFCIKDCDAARRIALGCGGNIHTTGQKVNLSLTRPSAGSGG